MSEKRTEYLDVLANARTLAKALSNELQSCDDSLDRRPDSIGALSIQAARYAAQLQPLLARLRDLGIDLTPVPSFVAPQDSLDLALEQTA